MRPVRPSVAMLLVVVPLAGGLVAVTRWPPDPIPVELVASVDVVPSDAQPRSVLPVSSRTLVCPDASPLTAGSSTEVTLVSPELTEADATSSVADGSRASVQQLAPGVTPLVLLAEHGPAATALVQGSDAGPMVVATVGTLAPGLSASQLSTAGAGEVTGVAAASCTEPSAESWFLGMGTELGHRPRLSISNAERAVAELDVTLYGPDGRLEITSLRGLVVAAGGTETFELDALAPDLSELAVEVRVRSGRVAAAVRDSRVDGLSSLGVEWVARSVSPATRLVVPGVNGAGGGERLLQLLAPGELDTRVRVRLWTRTGPIVPVGFEEVELTAGAVSSVDLAAAVGAEVVAVELTADQPIVAGLRAVSSGTDQREMAYTAAAAPLAGPAVLADVRAGDGWAGLLALSADDGGPDGAPPPSGSPPAPAQVLVRYLDAESGDVVRTEEMTVPTGSSVEVPLTGDDLPQRFSVIVTPVAGMVYGALQLQRSGGPDGGLTVLPLVSPQLVVEVPAVRHDLLSVLRPLA